MKKISPVVDSVTVEPDGESKKITLVLVYTGEEEVGGQISEGEELTLELPSKPQP